MAASRRLLGPIIITAAAAAELAPAASDDDVTLDDVTADVAYDDVIALLDDASPPCACLSP